MRSVTTVSESQAAIILKGQENVPWRTVVCVRRQVPDWWVLAKSKHREVDFVHSPVCASIEPRFAMQVWRFIRGALPRFAGPVLLFCSEGRHRSGVIAALTQRGRLLVSIAYLRRAGFRARLREWALLLILERRLNRIGNSTFNWKR